MKAGVVLQGAVQKAESWKCKVRELIPLYGKARTCTKRQLEQLLFEAQVQYTHSVYPSIIFLQLSSTLSRSLGGSFVGVCSYMHLDYIK
jgi:hypothetical protein